MDGDVVLTGSVPSHPQYVQAAGVAPRAAGVRCVRNHLTGVRSVRNDIQIRDLEQP